MPQPRPSIPALPPLLDPLRTFSSSLAESEPALPNTLLVDQGESLPFVRLIRSGIVKISYMDEGGSETTQGLRSQGWWVGGTSTLVGLASLYRVTTLTACQLSSVSSDRFLSELLGNHGMLQQFLSNQCRELLTGQHHTMMQGNAASERLRFLTGERSGCLGFNGHGKAASPLSCTRKR